MSTAPKSKPTALPDHGRESINRLSFAQLREANLARQREVFHDNWTPTDWACAMAGECGETCNEVKKLRRLGPTPEEISDVNTASGRFVLADAKKKIGDELADTIIYADLLAHRLGIDLGEAIAKKFNEVSARVGSAVNL